MRTLFATAIALGITSLSSTSSPAWAEPPRFEVPRTARAEPRAAEAQREHELVLPADVVARPGESPREALARALRAEPAPRVESK